MVYKRSEYGHQFKVSSLVKNVPVYKEHLSYRHFRRERECAHTPLSWDGEIIESSESDEKLNDDDVRLPISELVITEEDETGNDKTSHDEKDDATDDDDEDDEVVKQKKAQKKAAESKQVDDEKCEVVVTKQNEDLRKSAKQKLNNYVNSKNKKETLPSKDGCDKKVFGKTFAKPTPASDKLFVKSSKPRRPDRQVRIPKTRPQSAPASRQLVQGVENSQPFLNYGGGSSNRNLGDKKTFNIKAACAVYPAALRARKRNLLLIEKQQERARTASAREKKRKAKFNNQIARETALWDTEYRRSYPCYENTEYSTSERDPRKQKSYFLS